MFEVQGKEKVLSILNLANLNGSMLCGEYDHQKWNSSDADIPSPT